MEALLKWLGGYRDEDEKRSWRFRWGEISTRYPKLPSLTYSIYHDEAHFCIGLVLFAIYIKVPVWITFREGTEDWNACYGFTFTDSGIHLNWRTKCKIIHYPWEFEWESTELLDPTTFEVLMVDKKRKRGESYDHSSWLRYYERKNASALPFDYTYVLKNGTVQKRIASCSVERRTRRRWCFPWIRKVSTEMYVDFNQEVGERTGSWKGGVTGCGWDLRPGETVEMCLRRMEATRKFE